MSDDDLRRLCETLADSIMSRLSGPTQSHECPLAEPEAAKKHDKHHDYIDVVMAREAERTAVRRAVIEKSLAGLVWSGVVALGAAVWAYMKDHLK